MFRGTGSIPQFTKTDRRMDHASSIKIRTQLRQHHDYLHSSTSLCGLRYAHRLPKPGETLHGTKFVKGFGGKGANQCVAAAKLGASAALVAKVGNDSFGRDFIEALKSRNVNTQHVTMTDNDATGMAQITVADSGENQIVIATGANNELSESDVDRAAEFLRSADVLVFQAETPIETTLYALRHKDKNSNAVSIVNLAPGMENPNPDLLKLCDIFCVNESEAEMVLHIPITSIESAKHAALKLIEKGSHKAIITLGGQGAVYVTEQDRTPVHVPTTKMVPVDTTGAGDMFIGALAYYLAYHKDLKLEEIVRRSCEVASVSVLKPGTQTSFPSREELPKNLFE